MATLNRLELRRAARARNSLSTATGTAALEPLEGDAVQVALRCVCGVLVIRGSKLRECPRCDRRLPRVR